MEHPLAYKFHQAYANLPLGIRGEIIAVVDGEPMSWKVVKLELDGGTEMGFKVMEYLVRLGIFTK